MHKKMVKGMAFILCVLLGVLFYGYKDRIALNPEEKIFKPLQTEEEGKGARHDPEQEGQREVLAYKPVKEVQIKYDDKLLENIAEKYASNTGYTVYIGLYDFKAGKYSGYNDDIIFYPASLTKAIYLAALMQKAEAGKIDLKENYILQNSDKYIEGTMVGGTGVLQYITPGREYSYRKLAELMITASDNIAANVILDKIGIEEVNAYCREKGLVKTNMYRHYYEVNSDKPSNQSTARDLTWFLVRVAEDAKKESKGAKEVINIMQANPDKRIGKYVTFPFKVANKTGTVEKMAGDMALFYSSDEPVLALTVIVKAGKQAVVNHQEAEKIIALIARELLAR